MTSRFQKTFVKDKPELDKFNEPISNNTINITKGVGDKQSSLSQNFGSSVTNGFNSSCDNLKVVIRVRPALSREIDDGLPFRSIVLLSNENKSINLVEYLGAELTEKERQREWIENPNLFQLHRFSFDHAFDMDATQQEVYEVTAKPAIMSVLEGYNSTVFAYGQTGTGKTYTMEGFTYSSSDMNRGIIQRSIEEIFNYIEQFSNSNTKFMVRAGYIQIYNEMISDLLKSEKTNLQIREDKKKGVYVEGQSEWAVRTPSDIYALLKRGASSRATSFTMMNDVSSRSHAVFRITVEQMTIVENSKSQVTQIKVGKLNLVDLAGSERIRVTGAKGKQLEESKNINKSLSALGNVIYALTDTKGRTHIPYRDSKLTRLLEDSLGGNCKTTMMAMISPSHVSFNESLSTLHFARRAKNIKNKPKINEDLDQKALIRQYEDELKKLRSELEQKNKLISTNNIMTSLNCSNMSEMEIFSQLEEQKKRAEEDKNLAILALEQASKQYLQERDEKKRLESKISLMNSQMLVGGTKIEDTPQFRTALEEKQSVLLREFDLKLQEFEKERQQVEEGKAQVEKYRQLLLKQRDIMIALTTKLNERDEMIVQFQDEIDAYDKINKEQEDLISNKSDRVSILEKLLRRSNLPVPDEIMNAQHSYCKNSSRYQDNKLYIPFEVEQNQAEYENKPVSMLTSDEKVKELTYIIKEQEKEVSVLRILSQRLINQANESNPNQSQNFAEAYTRDRNNVESHTKINLLESEKSLLTKSLEEKGKLNF